MKLRFSFPTWPPAKLWNRQSSTFNLKPRRDNRNCLCLWENLTLMWRNSSERSNYNGKVQPSVGSCFIIQTKLLSPLSSMWEILVIGFIILNLFWSKNIYYFTVSSEDTARQPYTNLLIRLPVWIILYSTFHGTCEVWSLKQLSKIHSYLIHVIN